MEKEPLLLIGNIYFDDNYIIHIHQSTLNNLLLKKYPNFHTTDNTETNLIRDKLKHEAIFVLIEDNKYYHLEFILKLLKLKL